MKSYLKSTHNHTVKHACTNLGSMGLAVLNRGGPNETEGQANWLSKVLRLSRLTRRVCRSDVIVTVSKYP